MRLLFNYLMMQYEAARICLASAGEIFASVVCFLPVHTEGRIKINIECPGFFQSANQRVKEYS